MRMDLIDSHCHLYSSKFDSDREEVISRAKENGVSRILLPNIDSSSIGPMLSLSNSHPELCLPMMGIHPCSVGPEIEKDLELVSDWFSKEKFIAVGEIGLDLYWDKTYLKEQLMALEYQFDLALKKDLPAVIHCRDAFEELKPVLDKYSKKDLKAVLHRFTGNIDDAQFCIERGYYLGIGGVYTFKNSGLSEVLSEIGLDRILLETDSPYLAPVPNRGKRNEPAYTRLVAEAISKDLSISFEDVVQATGTNTKRLFEL